MEFEALILYPNRGPIEIASQSISSRLLTSPCYIPVSICLLHISMYSLVCLLLACGLGNSSDLVLHVVPASPSSER